MAENVHEFELKTIEGNTKSLSDWKGQVLLLVNVASKCGFTPQYAGLEKLHADYAGKGVVVMGIPANDFGAQEPGSDAEIQAFCTSKYGVSFPMFAKIVVTGPDQHPLYAHMTQARGEVDWNFNKFLVGKDGQVIARFASSVSPESDELRAAIDTALTAPG